MLVLNTGAADFWGSMIGEQLRLLRVTSLQYHLAGALVRALVERIAKEALPKCRRMGWWPTITVRGSWVILAWRGRGEVAVSLKGDRMSYTPDPIRKSSTIGMVLDLASGQPGSVDKFVKGCLWHMLEVLP